MVQTISHFYRIYWLLVLSCFWMIVGACSLSPVLKKEPGQSSAEKKLVDPFVAREKKWQKLVIAGDQAYQDQNLALALEKYLQAVALKPDKHPPQLRVAEIYYQLQEYEKARDAFVQYLELEPTDRNAHNYLGYIYESLQNSAQAAEQFEQSLRLYDQDLYALNHLGLAYKQLGQYQQAEETLRQALAIDPKCERTENRNLHNYLALIYQASDQTGEAIAELRESIRLFPEETWARTQVANLYENHGRYYEAQLQYAEILKVEPDNLLAQSRLQALSQARTTTTIANVVPVDLLEIDTDAIIANAPSQNDYPHDDAIILLNQFCHEITPAGKSRYTSHKIIKILTERGLQKHDDLAIPYSPNSQYITVNVARTILIDGTSIEPSAEAYNDVTPPGQLTFNLYSDTLWRVISMPALEAGVCIEYKVSLEDTVPSGTDRWFWGGYSFQSTDPTLQSNYALRLSSDKPFRWKSINCQLEPDILVEGETKTYLWHYGQTPAIREVVGQPSVSELAAQLQFSSVDSWDAVAKWYADLAQDRYTTDANVEELAQQLAQDATSKLDKAHRLYNFVASQIRYVSIQLGQGAYQPTPADQVLKKRYGDCKDKSTLLISLLSQVGISAYPALLSPSPYEAVDLDLPSVGQFSHLIVAVPRTEVQQLKGQKMESRYLWLDPTASSCQFGVLPASNQGRTALVVKDEQANFARLPVSPPETNHLSIRTDLRIQSDGSTHGQISILPTGQYDLDYRLAYRDIPLSALKSTFEAELSRNFSGLVADRHQISDLRDLDQNIEIHLDFRAGQLTSQIDGQHLLLHYNGADFEDYTDIFISEEREYPLDLSHPILVEKSTVFYLPSGWRPLDLPHDQKRHSEKFVLQHQFAELTVIRTYIETQIEVILTLRVDNPVITPEIYVTAKSFFQKLVEQDRHTMILKKSPAS